MAHATRKTKGSDVAVERATWVYIAQTLRGTVWPIPTFVGKAV